MAKIVNFSIDLKKIDKSKLIEGKKGTYLNLTASLNDEADAYGNDVAVYVSQSKEEREGKEKRNYLGNGKVVWSSDNNEPDKADGDFPF